MRAPGNISVVTGNPADGVYLLRAGFRSSSIEELALGARATNR